jgi:hypothetical protein
MKLSQGDRSALIARVEQRLGGRAVSRAAIQAAVDQVLNSLSLPDESPSRNHVVFALSAESMPDLSSRVRQKMSTAGEARFESGTATVGRYTVATIRGPVELRARLEQAALELGARFSVVDRDDQQAGSPRP